ncbi:MAG TPA: hypothetical protein VN618_01685 [Solirubrobacteraceae bacterium]|nr:hypothetical protein [Solirubrobacteraceae bacterium]
MSAGRSDAQATTLADEFLPVYDVSDAVAVVVDADLDVTWEALLRTDLIEVGRRKPLVAVLGAVRMLPDLVAQILHGERPQSPERMTLGDLAAVPSAEGGWTLLGERPREEIALGLVGRFWRPVIEFAGVDAGDFTDFSEPGYAKTIYSLSTRALGDGRTLLTGLMRTATTDEHARRYFRRYWTFGVGSGAHVLVNGLLEVVRDDAEAQAASAA